jgi:hypothetical protein
MVIHLEVTELVGRSAATIEKTNSVNRFITLLRRMKHPAILGCQAECSKKEGARYQNCPVINRFSQDSDAAEHARFDHKLCAYFRFDPCPACSLMGDYAN